MWIIDFGTACAEEQAALYEAPFEFVRTHVYPKRQKNKREAYRLRWWLHVEARSGMRESLRSLPRFIATILPPFGNHPFSLQTANCSSPPICGQSRSGKVDVSSQGRTEPEVDPATPGSPDRRREFACVDRATVVAYSHDPATAT